LLGKEKERKEKLIERLLYECLTRKEKLIENLF